jgi:hypothetical protein
MGGKTVRNRVDGRQSKEGQTEPVEHYNRICVRPVASVFVVLYVSSKVNYDEDEAWDSEDEGGVVEEEIIFADIGRRGELVVAAYGEVAKK